MAANSCEINNKKLMTMCEPMMQSPRFAQNFSNTKNDENDCEVDLPDVSPIQAGSQACNPVNLYTLITFLIRRVRKRDRRRSKALTLSFRSAPVSFSNSSNRESYERLKIGRHRNLTMFNSPWNYMCTSGR